MCVPNSFHLESGAILISNMFKNKKGKITKGKPTNCLVLSVSILHYILAMVFATDNKKKKGGMGAIKIELKEYKRKGITSLSDLDFDILNMLMQCLRLKPSAFPAHTRHDLLFKAIFSPEHVAYCDSSRKTHH